MLYNISTNLSPRFNIWVTVKSCPFYAGTFIGQRRYLRYLGVFLLIEQILGNYINYAHEQL